MSATECGRRVAVIRHARLMRQRDLAKAAGVTRQTVSEVECGRPATVRVMQRIAEALGVEISALLDGAMPRVPASPRPDKK